MDDLIYRTEIEISNDDTKNSASFLQISGAAFILWALAGLVGALPFYISGYIPRFTDAVFESVSGFTTTGFTVMNNIDAAPRLLLFWRSLTQWLGGFGFLIFLTAFRPMRAILSVYTCLTLLETLLLRFFGMNWFDAITHAFSTISTGGFSTHGNGIAFYHSAVIEWVLALFMFLSGFNYLLLWQMISGRLQDCFCNSEAKVYAAIVVLSSVIITIVVFSSGNVPAGAMRNAFFNAASFLSTTGFSGTDIHIWPAFAQGILFFLMFIGGCSFSTAGGIKVVRFVILAKQAGNEMKKMIHPRGVYTIQLDGKSGKKEMVYGTAGFVYLYCLLIFVCALLVSSAGETIFTSLNTALACLGNIGMGLGKESFNQCSGFPGYVKWGLSLAMIMGRLELWAVLVLFTRGIKKG